MTETIEMKDMMYLNIFERVTKIRTRHSFSYNNTIYFCVDRKDISRAIGPQGSSAKKIGEILNKKIKIIPLSEGIENSKDFIENVIAPLSFKNFEIRGDEMIITAGSQNKAILLGRNKRRFIELQKVVKDYFRKDLKIL